MVVNPLIITKRDYFKIVLFARHQISNTGQSSESCPLKPLRTQLATAKKLYKSAVQLIYAYAQATLDDEIFKLNGFSYSDKLSAFIRCLYGFKGLPFSSNVKYLLLSRF